MERKRSHSAPQPKKLDGWTVFNASLQRVTLLDALQSLTFGESFNQSLEGVNVDIPVVPHKAVAEVSKIENL